MPKNKGSKRARSGGKGSGEGSTSAWTASDHIVRKAKQQRKADDKQELRAQRSALLTRDSKEKREAGKLRLHMKRVQRQIDTLRSRLESWDDEDERKLAVQNKKEEEARKKELENPTKKKKGRKGPETWKLKGAARPASEIYDFDTRYVDPYLKAHEDAKKKAQRSRNVFALCKGRFGEEQSKDVPQPFCRDFLSLLMQMGNLAQQANQLKTARKSFLECLDLDSTPPITNARCQLMRLYMDANRPDSARRLWEKLGPEDPSVWIRYSAALIEYVSWKLLEEEGSTQQTAEALLARAIQTNLYCAYYLAFSDTFIDAIDYGDEIEDANEDSPLEEAIEYCNSEQMGAWQGTEGACQWIRSVIMKGLKDATCVADGALKKEDLEWRQKLSEMRQRYEESRAAEDGENGENESNMEEEESGNQSDEEMDDDELVVDLGMFIGMFETAMEMVEDSDEYKQS
ncbi:unnamed protein product [Cylindrotheca closterium]|uniref:Uncharacterized protein n=1 Tax=Cylindrotheca closterium TaxID=2856 RepID=A0AAD2GA08_9STRA|nr:unnamed protein product [Cylindrotheca closterium]